MAHEGYTALSRYIGVAKQAPLLGRSDEIVLATRWRALEDRDAAETLVRAHLRYVVALAVRYRRYGVPLDELIAEGNFGLVRALAKFEPERGNRFATYAVFWVRAYILDYIIRSWSMVGGGCGPLRSKLFFRLRRERARIAGLVGSGEEADALLGDRLGMSPAELGKMMRRIDARDVSLDQPIYSDAGVSLVDALVATDKSQEQALMATQMREHLGAKLRSALARLDPRERYIVDCRLRADGADQHSLAAIGRYLGVSRERARQLEARTKRKLRAAISEAWREASGGSAPSATVGNLARLSAGRTGKGAQARRGEVIPQIRVPGLNANQGVAAQAGAGG
jgi:RNA polymerase sigma-32 factor